MLSNSVDKVKKIFTQGADNLGDNVNEAIDDASETVGKVKQAVGAMVTDAKEVYKDNYDFQLSHLNSSLETQADRAKSATLKGVNKFEEYVKSHPYQSLLTAFGVGYLAATLVKNNK